MGLNGDPCSLLFRQHEGELYTKKENERKILLGKSPTRFQVDAVSWSNEGLKRFQRKLAMRYVIIIWI